MRMRFLGYTKSNQDYKGILRGLGFQGLLQLLRIWGGRHLGFEISKV